MHIYIYIYIYIHIHTGTVYMQCLKEPKEKVLNPLGGI